MTNIKGCFAIGECEFQYHGANRLGANSLVACIYAGLLAGTEVPRYIENLAEKEVSEAPFKEALDFELAFKDDLLSRSGPENVHKLHDEMADYMIRFVTVKRDNEDLEKVMVKLKEIRERYQNITLDDKGELMNQTFQFANQFRYMLELAMVITKGALLRNEFRGSHFKPDYPKRDDENWLKHTIATYKPDEPEISYIPVDIRYLQPIMRDYTKAKRVKPKLENIPEDIKLPL